MLAKAALFYLFIFSISLNVFPQAGTFKSTIHIRNLPSQYQVFLVLLSEKKDHVSNIQIAKLDSITYQATGKLDYPCAAKIEIKNRKQSRTFCLSTGAQFIDVHFDSLYYPLKVTGSKDNEELLNDYLPFLSAYRIRDDNWWKDYNDLKTKNNGILPGELEDSMTFAKKSIEVFRDSVIHSYVASHRNSYISFWKLYENFKFYGFTDA